MGPLDTHETEGHEEEAGHFSAGQRRLGALVSSRTVRREVSDPSGFSTLSFEQEEVRPSAEWLLQPNIEELVALPDVPYKIDIDDNGAVYVTERSREIEERDQYRPPVSTQLYERQRAAPQRLDELKKLARYAGFNDIAELVASQVNMDVVEEHAPASLTRRFPAEPSALDALREMQRAALEQLISTRLIELGRQLIDERLPQFVPQEQTVALVEPDVRLQGANAVYDGRYGNAHLIRLKLQHHVTREFLDTVGTDSQVVQVVAVHELLHQRHAEIQHVVRLGSPESDGDARFNETTLIDPWEIYQLSLEHTKLLREEAQRDTERAALTRSLCIQLRAFVVETIAYLGQAEVAGQLNYHAHLHEPEESDAIQQHAETEQHWISTYASLAPLGARSHIIDELMHVDLRQFSTLTPGQLEELINNPQMVLQYVAREPQPRG